MNLWTRKRDDHVLFVIHYDDGRNAYIRVLPSAIDVGLGVLGVARERQEEGEIPPGSIIGVKRVR
jgi:hypothetical protein